MCLANIIHPQNCLPILVPIRPWCLTFSGVHLGTTWVTPNTPKKRGEDLTNEEVKSRKITKCHPANSFFIKILQLNGPNSETPTWI